MCTRTNAIYGVQRSAKSLTSKSQSNTSHIWSSLSISERRVLHFEWKTAVSCKERRLTLYNIAASASREEEAEEREEGDPGSEGEHYNEKHSLQTHWVFHPHGFNPYILAFGCWLNQNAVNDFAGNCIGDETLHIYDCTKSCIKSNSYNKIKCNVGMLL